MASNIIRTCISRSLVRAIWHLSRLSNQQIVSTQSDTSIRSTIHLLNNVFSSLITNKQKQQLFNKSSSIYKPLMTMPIAANKVPSKFDILWTIILLRRKVDLTNRVVCFVSCKLRPSRHRRSVATLTRLPSTSELVLPPSASLVLVSMTFHFAYRSRASQTRN